MTEPEDQEFSAFFGREFERTVRTAYLVLHDQQAAEDVAQDAFGQLYRCWAKVRGYDNPQAWVRRVAIRMAVRVARRRSRRAPTPWAVVTGRRHQSATWTSRPRCAPCPRSSAPRWRSLLRGPVGRGGRRTSGLLGLHGADASVASPRAAGRATGR